MYSRRRAALASMTIVLGILLSGCGVVEVKAVKCDIKGNAPHESKGSPGWIDSKGTTYCYGNGRVTKVRASIILQKKKSGKWVSLKSTRNDRTVSPLKLKKKYTVMTRALRCSNGTYRTGVRVTGYVDGKKFDFGGKSWGWGQATKIKCK